MVLDQVLTMLMMVGLVEEADDSQYLVSLILASYWSGLHKLWYPVVRDMSTWSKFGAHGEHGDVFLFSNLGAL